jgi:hypothetical protein
VPWELLHDGEEFLGLRFQLTRLPTLRAENPTRGEARRHVGAVHNLLGKDVLDAVAQQAWADSFPAKPGLQVTHHPNGGGVFPNLDRVNDAAAGADLVCITCHGGLLDPGSNEYYWTLDDASPQTFDYRFTADTIRGLSFKRRPLVFGNACTSSLGFAPAPGANPGGGPAVAVAAPSAVGFGGAFLTAGARNFVGTIAPVSQRLAIAVAREFYALLLGDGQPGKPVAAALWAAKKKLHDAVPRTDPCYLFYALYGPAETTWEVP